MDTVWATAACAGCAVWAAVRLTLAPVADADSAPERRRRDRLREKSAVYRFCEWPVLALAAVLHRQSRATVDRVTAALDALGEEDWRGEEYLAARTLPLLAAVPAVGVAAGYWHGPGTGLCLALVLAAAAPLAVARWVRRTADARVREIRARLPHTLDLMALVLEAGGGTLFDCLEFGAGENAGNPLGEELRRAVHGIAQGSPPPVVLAEISRRLADPEVTEVNRAVAASETRGLSLKDNLRAVASRLRTRQAQWLERASERAKVHITWPVMLAMVACLAIFVAPIAIGGFAAGGDLIP